MNGKSAKTLCRGCLSENTTNLISFSDNWQMANLFSECIQLKIEKNDGLPMALCKECIAQCNSWNKFRLQCKRSYLKLMELESESTLNSLKSCSSGSHMKELIDTDDDDRSSPNKSNYTKQRQITEKLAKKKCDECGKTFRLQQRLDAHFNKFHLGLKAAQCSICCLGFSSIGNLRRHHTLQHDDTQVKPFQCKHCDRTFMFPSSLVNHSRIHQNIRDYICDCCGKGFVHKNGLLSHMLSHSSETPFACTECEKRFKSNETLRIHRRRHNSTKPYVCPECGKLFTTSGELKTHTRTHTGIRPYTCDQCTMSFKTISQLYVHQRKHTGARPYPCDICHKSFTAAKVLKLHRMIHTGEKPHNCLVCRKSFRQKFSLHVHMERHK